MKLILFLLSLVSGGVNECAENCCRLNWCSAVVRGDCGDVVFQVNHLTSGVFIFDSSSFILLQLVTAVS